MSLPKQFANWKHLRYRKTSNDPPTWHIEGSLDGETWACLRVDSYLPASTSEPMASREVWPS